MNYTIQQVENAILSALAPMTTGMGGTVKTLAGYQGQLGEAVGAGNQLIALCPALLVAYLGSSFTPMGDTLFERVFRFAVLHGASNLQSESKRRNQAYTLLDTSRGILNNNTLGLDITPMLVERELGVAQVGKLSVYSAEYKTSFLEDSTL